MWQRFTERARRVILLGQEEAGRMSSGHVGTEHILLGLMRENEGVAAQILLKMSVSLAKVRAEIENELQPSSDAGGWSEPKLTPKAKQVLENAADEARRMRHNYIGTEHLLLALLRDDESIAATTLQRLGLHLAKARAEVLMYLGADVRLAPVAEAETFVPTPHDVTTPKGQIWRALTRFVNNLNQGEAFPLNFKLVFEARVGYFGANKWAQEWNEERMQRQIGLREIDFIRVEGEEAEVKVGYSIASEQPNKSLAVQKIHATGWTEPLLLKLDSKKNPPLWQIVPPDEFPTSENPFQPPFLAQAAFALAQKDAPHTSQWQAERSLSCLKQLSLAALQFSADWEENFSFEALFVSAALAPYLTSSRHFIIPGTEEQYAFNNHLSGLELEEIIKPHQTVLFYEGENQNLVFRYDNQAAVAFVNGSCRLVSPEAAPDLIWEP